MVTVEIQLLVWAHDPDRIELKCWIQISIEFKLDLKHCRQHMNKMVMSSA
jgi:hypothetical protein